MKNTFFLLLMVSFYVPLFAQNYQGKLSKKDVLTPREISLTSIKIWHDFDLEDDWSRAVVIYEIRLVAGKKRDLYYLTVRSEFATGTTEAEKEYLEAQIAEERKSYETILSEKPKNLIAVVEGDKIRYLAKKDQIWDQMRMYDRGEILWVSSEL